jgi:hypothetical protein
LLPALPSLLSNGLTQRQALAIVGWPVDAAVDSRLAARFRGRPQSREPEFNGAIQQRCSTYKRLTATCIPNSGRAVTNSIIRAQAAVKAEWPET